MGMQRRSVLIALGGVLPTAGCLTRGGDGEVSRTEAPNGDGDRTSPTDAVDDGDGSAGTATDRRYEECPREIIPYEQFPAEIRTEIDAALDGRYADAHVCLREAMDVTESYVAVDDTYYDPTVATNGETEVLTLQRVEPKALPSGRPITVNHRLDGERVITVEVVDDDGAVLVDTTMDLWPGGDVEFGRIARVGTHEFRITVADADEVETEVTEPVRFTASLASVHIIVEPEEVQVREAVADAPICRFTL